MTSKFLMKLYSFIQVVNAFMLIYFLTDDMKSSKHCAVFKLLQLTIIHNIRLRFTVLFTRLKRILKTKRFRVIKSFSG